MKPVSNPPAQTMWTLEQSLRLIRTIQYMLYPHGYCITLGGGVLNNGVSRHDLDLVLIPLSHFDGIADAVGACSVLEQYGQDVKDATGQDNYAWLFQDREQIGEITLVRYRDFHTEKVVELRFVTETNIWT